MIKDNSILTEIKLEWQGVEKLRDSLSLDAMASFAIPTLAGRYPFKLAKAAQNLPFIHACAVLNNVLEILASDGHFESKSKFLGALIKASKTSLPWVNYELIGRALKERNDVAHNGHLVEKKECLKYIAAIRVELVSWGIIT